MPAYISRALAAIVLSMSALAVMAQDTLPYKEGVVVIVTAVRTQPGKFNEYFRYLSGAYSQMMNQAKTEGAVSDYSFYATLPRSPDDPDLYIVETYPNMAAFDTITERMTVISNKVFGSLKQAEVADANREEIRKILGSEMLRKLTPAAGTAAR